MAIKEAIKSTTDLSTVTAGIAAGDTLKFHEGGQVVSAGLDFSALAQLADVIVNAAFTGDIGGGTYGALTFGATGVFEYAAANGSATITPTNIAGGGSANTIATVWNIGSGKLSIIGSGNVTNYEQRNGGGKTATIGESIVVTNAWQFNGDLEAGYNATVFTILNIGGGSMRCRRGFTTAKIGGRASVTFARDTTQTSSSIAGTTLDLYEASVSWKGGAITTLNVLNENSVFDWRQMNESATIGTINAPAGWINRHGLRSGASNTSHYGATLTVTNLNAKGGRVAY